MCIQNCNETGGSHDFLLIRYWYEHQPWSILCILSLFFTFRISAHNQKMWSYVPWSWDLPLQPHSERKWWVSQPVAASSLQWCVSSRFFLPSFIFAIKHPHLCLSSTVYAPYPPSSLSVCQTLVKEAVVHPLEVEPGQFLPQTEQSPAPPPAPQTSSHPGRARISLSISVGPTPVLPSTVTRSTLMPRSPTLDDGMRGLEGWRERSRGREKWGITKERVRGRLSQQKERKATQMLAIVLGEWREVPPALCFVHRQTHVQEYLCKLNLLHWIHSYFP